MDNKPNENESDKTITVYGYRRNGGHKIHFPITYHHIKKDSDGNIKRAVKEARKETKRLNKFYKFRGKQKIVSITILHQVVLVY